MEPRIYQNVLRKAHRAHYIAQSVCDIQLLLPLAVDEISVLFRSEHQLEEFMHHVGHDRSVDHFNSVPEDVMLRMDAVEEFRVRFEFLRIIGAAWRIEAMCILSGDAPLHEEALTERGGGSVMHASYKLEDTDAYDRDVSEGGRLGQYGGCKKAQYLNNYGLFSYWSFDDLGHTYLKPRVNLRDTVRNFSPAASG